MDGQAILRRLGYTFSEEEYEQKNRDAPANVELYRPAEIYKMPVIVISKLLGNLSEAFVAMDLLVHMMGSGDASHAFTRPIYGMHDEEMFILDFLVGRRIADGYDWQAGAGLFEICARQTFRNRVTYMEWMSLHAGQAHGITNILQEIFDVNVNASAILTILVTQLPDEFFTQTWRIPPYSLQVSGPKTFLEDYGAALSSDTHEDSLIDALATTFPTVMQRTPAHMLVEHGSNQPHAWVLTFVEKVASVGTADGDIRVQFIALLSDKMREVNFDVRSYIREKHSVVLVPEVREYINNSSLVKRA